MIIRNGRKMVNEILRNGRKNRQRKEIVVKMVVMVEKKRKNGRKMDNEALRNGRTQQNSTAAIMDHISAEIARIGRNWRGISGVS